MTETVKDHILKIKLGTVVVMVTTLISLIFGMGIGYEKIQARLRHLDAKTDLYSTRFDSLEKRVDSNDIKFAEIQKDLSAIESILLELKNRLK